MHFSPESLSMDLPEGILVEGRPSGRVDAVCFGCAHEWRLRGVSQISDVRARLTTEAAKGGEK